MKFDFIANIKDGIMSDKFQDSINRYILSLNDGPVRVQISRYKRTRSDRENRYYWGVVVKLISEYTGYTDDEVHAMLKMMFLRKRTDGMPETVMSTHKLNTQEFEEYIEKIKRFAATDMQLYIPDPE